MRKYRLWICIVLILGLALSLAGCGSDTKKAETEATDSAVTTEELTADDVTATIKDLKAEADDLKTKVDAADSTTAKDLEDTLDTLEEKVEDYGKKVKNSFENDSITEDVYKTAKSDLNTIETSLDIMEKTLEAMIDKYFRPGRLPHIWCPGCGNGVVTGTIVKAVAKLDLDKDKVAVISGIGCSSRASGYLDFNTVHSAHGRALPVATGVKLADPGLTVIVVTGDGDATAIGGNHLIHAARRNIDMTVVLYNNSIYGMTGGQYSPLTPTGSKATTAPYATIEQDFNVAELVKAAGATFVARGTTFHAQILADLIAKGIEHKGFSLIEAVTACPISYGRQNKMGGPADMMKWQRDHAVPLAAWDKMTEEQKAGKFPIGVLYQVEGRQEYTAAYDELIARAQGGK